MSFTTPIFHPNVSLDGEIELHDPAEWSPVVTVEQLLVCLQFVLSNPNPEKDCFLNQEAAKVFMEDEVAFKEKAWQWTMNHAVDLITFD